MTAPKPWEKACPVDWGQEYARGLGHPFPCDCRGTGYVALSVEEMLDALRTRDPLAGWLYNPVTRLSQGYCTVLNFPEDGGRVPVEHRADTPTEALRAALEAVGYS